MMKFAEIKGKKGPLDLYLKLVNTFIFD